MINPVFWLGINAPKIPDTVVEKYRAKYENIKYTCSHVDIPKGDFLTLLELAEKASR